ncbi:MAG TPA: tetratricopeptide repeat protein [Rhizobiales bacterium]|nr:tetratricopeptide repeat protein [Hyphomicrobiales bacterium]
MSNLLQQGLDYQRAENFSMAADAFRQVLKTDPENADAIHYLGLSLWQITQLPDEPLRLMQRSLKLTPNSAAKHHNIAALYGSLGDIETAIDHYKKSIALSPDYAEAYFNLSGVYKFSKEDHLIADMQSLYGANNLDDRNQEFLVYALSKAMNDIGNYHEALHFALEGARLKSPDYDQKQLEASVAEQRQNLTKDFLAPVKGRGLETDAPIFIVGMPRSGTTLVETILSRHKEVFAAGELPMIGVINSQMREFAKTRMNFTGQANGFLPIMPADHFANAAKSCLKMVEQRADGRKFTRFTDKMPNNAFQLGLIALMFPGARIIHVRRHPLDTCVSCFFQRFRLGHEYSYRLDWLGHYYRHYVMTMNHWKKVLPLPILDVNYHDLVQDPEGQSRRLIDFAGLEWTNDCLSPQDADRSVMTASRWQVRQPIYKSSLDRWKRYEPWLPSLIEALGGWDWINQQVEGSKS